MSERDTSQITQKDLLELLFNQAQHNATREDVQDLDDKISNLREVIVSKEQVQIVKNEIKETNKRLDGLVTREELKQEVEKLDTKIDSIRTELKGEMTIQNTKIDKIDNRLWWIACLIVALAFKTEILALFQ